MKYFWVHVFLSTNTIMFVHRPFFCRCDSSFSYIHVSSSTGSTIHRSKHVMGLFASLWSFCTSPRHEENLFTTFASCIFSGSVNFEDEPLPVENNFRILVCQWYKLL